MPINCLKLNFIKFKKIKLSSLANHRICPGVIMAWPHPQLNHNNHIKIKSTSKV